MAASNVKLPISQIPLISPTSPLNTIVRVAHISLCNCTAYKHRITQSTITALNITDSSEPFVTYNVETSTKEVSSHISLTLSETTLSNPKVIALSYTWGEFDRQEILIGHHHNDPFKIVKLNLGAEWDVPELLCRLSELCEAAKVWMDQLCLPPKDDEIRAILAKIPDIYRSFDVVVIMPGSICQCLKPRRSDQRTDDWRQKMYSHSRNLQHGSKNIFTLPNQFSGEFRRIDHTSWCVNAFGASSWNKRIWTLQEFAYARSVRLVWNLKRELRCVFIATDRTRYFRLDEMSRYAQLWYLRCWKGERDRSAVSAMVWNEVCRYRQNLIEGIAGKSDSRNVRKEDITTAQEFVLGKRLDYKAGPTLIQKRSEEIYGLAKTINDLRSFKRGTTDLRDFVTAVWVKVRGYTVPKDYKAMTACQVLENAIIQLEKLCAATFPVLAPARLFSDQANGLWRPTLSLEDRNIRSSMDIYGSLVLGPPIFTFEGSIPLRISRPGASVSRRAQHYKQVWRSKRLQEIEQRVSKMMRNWSTRQTTGLLVWDQDFYPEGYSRVLALLNEGKEIDAAIERVGNLSDAQVSAISEAFFMQTIIALTENVSPSHIFRGIKPNVDHHKVIYKLVCHELGVNEELCRKIKLELAIAPDDPPMFGLVKAGHTLPRDSKDKMNIITISLSPENGKSRNIRSLSTRSR